MTPARPPAQEEVWTICAPLHDDADETLEEILLLYVFCMQLAFKIHSSAAQKRWWSARHLLRALRFPPPSAALVMQNVVFCELEVLKQLSYVFPRVT